MEVAKRQGKRKDENTEDLKTMEAMGMQKRKRQGL